MPSPVQYFFVQELALRAIGPGLSGRPVDGGDPDATSYQTTCSRIDAGGNMPRSKDFEPAQALDRAMDLFWRRGYAETALDDLVRHTGASRYGLYATFGDKRDLFLAVLERYSQAVMDPMIGALEDPRASVREIRGFFDRLFGVIRRHADLPKVAEAFGAAPRFPQAHASDQKNCHEHRDDDQSHRQQRTA